MIDKITNMIYTILDFIICRIIQIKLKEEQLETLTQFVKFGIVGLSNTVISYLLYVGSLLLFQRFGILPRTDYLIAQVIGFVLSVLWSFYWNRRMVFEADNEKVPWFTALIKTYISYAFTGLFLNTVLSIIWVQFLHIPKLYAPIINLLMSVPLNFVLNKFWAFKEKK